MTRAIIGGIIAVVIVVTAFVMTSTATSSVDSRVRKQLKKRADSAGELSQDTAALDGLRVEGWVKRRATLQSIVDTIVDKNRASRAEKRDNAIAEVKGQARKGEPPTVLIAFVDTKYDVMAHSKHKKFAPPALWKEGGKLKAQYLGLTLAMAKEKKDRRIISEYWNDPEFGLLRVGIAPVTHWIDEKREVKVSKKKTVTITVPKERLVGALVLGYAVDQAYVQRRSDLLGAHVAYFFNDTAGTSSFKKENGEEDTGKRADLTKALKEKGLAKEALDKGYTAVRVVTIDGEQYYASAGRLPRFPSGKDLGAGYPPLQAGALVLVPVGDAMYAKGKIKTATWVLALVALIASVIGLLFAASRLLHQVDVIEVGVNEITNGNLELSFRPVGRDLDGLAHSLNVMLARLLGRPEPGEEEYDEDGNIIMPGRLQFDTDLSEKDEEIVNLAREPEPDYYNRIFKEYCAGRESVGESVEGISYDNFVTKLRVNEASLKAKYQCESIRFKVTVKDGKVSLKPVPIV